MKTALYIHENHYYKGQDGSFYSKGQFANQYWDTYLNHFDKVSVIGRDGGDISNPQDLNRIEHKKLNIVLLPSLSGPKNAHKNQGVVQNNIKSMIENHTHIILRACNEFTWVAFKIARELNKPVAFEVTGCAFAGMWHYPSLIGKIYAPIRYLKARYMAKHADSALYVTDRFLQKRYPSPAPIQAAVSNVHLEAPSNTVLDTRKKKIKNKQRTIKLGLIGHFHHNLKGLDTAIKALSIVKSDVQKDVHLHVLGDGNINKYTALAKAYNVDNNVHFDGLLPSGDAVAHWLDDIDIYCQPSLFEGLPRAVIEAMARGCPVTGSIIAGIPELVSPDLLHGPKDAKTLAQHVITLINDKSLQIYEAERSFSRAKDFSIDKLAPKRAEFWGKFAKL